MFENGVKDKSSLYLLQQYWIQVPLIAPELQTENLIEGIEDVDRQQMSENNNQYNTWYW